MKEVVLTVEAFNSLIKESSNEFKAKLGPNVESEDKKNNGKAYSDAEKRAKDYDGGLQHEMLEEKPEYEKVDDNKTTLDYNPETVTPEYKKRVKAQVNGYTSEKEMNNNLEKSGDFSDNKKIYNALAKSAKERNQKEKEFEKSGLQAREWPDSVFDKENMYESKDGFNMRQMINHLRDAENQQEKSTVNETIKTVYFKKTKFITENHMITKIPDDFKVNGLKFKMKDADNNVYLVEWKNNKANVLSHINNVLINEEFNRMKSLMSYSPKANKTSSIDRQSVNDDTFRTTLNNARNIK